MRYLVATYDKGHKPKHIFGTTKSKSFALKRAKEFAFKYKISIGIFRYDKYNFYGLFDVIS